jgi:hypothetical protein
MRAFNICFYRWGSPRFPTPCAASAAFTIGDGQKVALYQWPVFLAVGLMRQQAQEWQADTLNWLIPSCWTSPNWEWSDTFGFSSYRKNLLWMITWFEKGHKVIMKCSVGVNGLG